MDGRRQSMRVKKSANDEGSDLTKSQVVIRVDLFFFYSCDFSVHYDSPCWDEGEAIFRHVVLLSLKFCH